MYSPRLSKAATTFRSESSSTGNTTCLQSDRVSRTGADFMGHTRTLSLKQGTRFIPEGHLSYSLLDTMLINDSHVSGVALQLQDGGGEAEPLVTVSSQNVPLGHNVVCGRAHKLVAVSTPAKHPQNSALIIITTFKLGLQPAAKK